MKQIRLAGVLALGLSLVTGNPASAVSQPEPPAGEMLAAGNTAFAVKLYHELRTTDGNLFFSPYSISSALAMTYGGARERTAKEMGDVLCFRLDQAQVSPAFRTLNQALAASARKNNQTLTIANGLCLTGGNVNDAFKMLLKSDYDAELFSGGLDVINGWVRRKTEGKIDKILESLDANSVCVILNAIYFKGIWERQFPKAATADTPFKISADKEVTVPLMYQKNKFRVLDRKDFQAAEIPYRGHSMSMIVLLPRAVDGLPELEKQLTAQQLNQWTTELAKRPPEETELLIPKFQMKTGYDLVSPCKAMGMTEAFDATGRADFSGIGGRKGDLFISQIKHKAFVDVNEEGTEAAAVTGVEMSLTMVREQPVFRADHPFLFLIRDNISGSILFLGRVVDPTRK